MSEDDEAPKRPPAGPPGSPNGSQARLVPLGLAPLGVAELGAYRAELVEEIARVDAEIARKQSHRSAADAFFRRPQAG